ncbi:L-aspartate oxidase [Miniphocaeibacter halophilus]|uniref:L-aspartate oxidase n=1 Tax=Miniphocaeibacter halophilus TaxID=2931922 RepID=A0AC61N8E9_9FIRM|nr:L-aspartate oxidase [Miniphocaeibacter halophilus]QQK08303.1 L-aspartate oxidase [Miniphocaeibacter halophilus]
MKSLKADTVIVGSGLAGLICALTLPSSMKVILLTKEKLEDSNSYLAQGGIAVMKGLEDKESFISDTLKAGHYKNDFKAVETLVEESPKAIESLEGFGVSFERKQGCYSYTREGGHSKNRILYCGDFTGKAIMDTLIRQVKKRENIRVLENCTMEDILVNDCNCYGVYAIASNGGLFITGKSTVIATGGIGGLYENTTNYKHIQGDGLALAIEHSIKLKDLSYIQIHPTALYENTRERRFLISESVRGEGAILLNKNKDRFIDELKPRDIVSKAIIKEMEKDKREFQWLRMNSMKIDIKKRFPKIYEYLRKIGLNPYIDDIPIVPAQHYTMGGIKVNLKGETSMPGLFAIGEASCTGVHGKNRLASNSLLESVVFSKRTADFIKNISKEEANINDFKIRNLSLGKKKEIIKEGIKIDEFTKTKLLNS